MGLLYALKSGSTRAFYRWLTRDSRALFPRLPERPRLLRLFTTHQDWTQAFLAAPTVLGVIDTYGIELIHPRREGRSPQQIGRKGLSNHRWIVGGTLCLRLNQWGLVVAWACATANVAENTFQWLLRQCEEQMMVLSDTAFHAAEGDPPNLKLCQRGAWEDRMLVETVLSMLTLVCHFKKGMHRVWAYFQARLAFTMAAFKVLVQWHGFQPYASGFVPLSIAEFSL
ncbi:MAG TPA: transposase [Candidatus Saccharimonadia bacterium]|nr:transposase [Candidatus Saccharimonadia bacterium]